MSLREKIDLVYNNRYVNTDDSTENNRLLKATLLKMMSTIATGTYDGVTYNKYKGTSVISGQTNVNENYTVSHIIDDETSSGTSTFTLQVEKEAIEGLHHFKMHMDSVANQVNGGALGSGFGNSVRMYYSSSNYSTVNVDLFKQAFGNYIMFDFLHFNETVQSSTKNKFLGCYNSSDSFITPAHAISLRFLGEHNLQVPIIPYTAPNATQYGSGNSEFIACNNVTQRTVTQSGTVTPSTVGVLQTVVAMYCAIKNNVDPLTNNIYTLMGNSMIRCTNNSGSYSFYIVEKDIIDELIVDLHDLTGLNITYTGDIPAPVPPGPSGDAVLDSLSVIGATSFTPAFNSEDTTYTARINNEYYTIQAIGNEATEQVGYSDSLGVATTWAESRTGNFRIQASEYPGSDTWIIKAKGYNGDITQYTITVETYIGEGTITEPGQSENQADSEGGSGDRTSIQVTSPDVPFTTTALLGQSYIMNYKAILQTQGEMWDPAFLSLLESLGDGGQSAVISCILFPFDITDFIQRDVTEIYLGSYNFTLSSGCSAGITSAVNREFVKDMGYLDYQDQYYGGFLDAQPYTHCYIYLPYHGYESIDPEIVYNHLINVKYLVDFTTGKAKIQIWAKERTTTISKLISEYTCQLGIPIEFNKNNLGQMKLEAAISAFKTFSSAAFGGYGAASDVITSMGPQNYSNTSEMIESMDVEAQYKLNSGFESMGKAAVTETRIPMGLSASAAASGTSCDFMSPQRPFLLFSIPETAVPENYNAVYGRPSLVTDAIGKYQGYMEIEAPWLDNIICTETERTMIAQAMQNGIRIVPVITEGVSES